MKSTDKVTVYTAETSRGLSFNSLFAMFRELPEANELGMRLFKRNLKGMYRQSLLGFFWALFPPLITAGLWIFLRSNNVLSVGDTGISYPVYVLTGTMLWQIFAESIQSPIKSVTSNKAMLVKINIPREALLLSGIYEVGFNLLIKIGLLFIVLIAFQQGVGFSLLMAPIGLLALILTGFSIGLILTPIGILYQDIQRGISVILPFLMYLTPVIYPKPRDGAIGMIMKINPIATILPETRNWFTGLPAEDWKLFTLYFCGFLILLVLGLIVYRLAMPTIIERIGS